MMAAVLLACLCAFAGAGLAEIGFAEVRMDRVNVRRSPGGDTRWQLDEGMSVYVYEETHRGDTLWCHVYTNVGKNTVTGWIRGDMLRFVSEEFEGVTQVHAGYNYVTGVRSDGTAAIMGFDMPHLPCIDEVRSWRDIVQMTSEICTVFALDASGKVLHRGRYGTYEGQRAAKLCGDCAILLDEDGALTAFSREKYCGDLPEWVAQGRYTEAHTLWTSEVNLLLTLDGRVIYGGQGEAYREPFMNGPYTDVDVFFDHVLALGADGRVDAMGSNAQGQCEVSGWTDVVKVDAGDQFSLGLRADGTVYCAGGDAALRERVALWRDVKDIAAGRGYCIALFADGHVEMAGTYKGYDR